MEDNRIRPVLEKAPPTRRALRIERQLPREADPEALSDWPARYAEPATVKNALSLTASTTERLIPTTAEPAVETFEPKEAELLIESVEHPVTPETTESDEPSEQTPMAVILAPALMSPLTDTISARLVAEPTLKAPINLEFATTDKFDPIWQDWHTEALIEPTRLSVRDKPLPSINEDREERELPTFTFP